ncbi:alpha-mannosidase [Pleomorphomonas koreensis]|uniref:alpha-mannosidase n=1 Tax=Pleomorphomonas koreensis TaxID=257440 RepID=UPI000422B883|nr:glycoside hydrolase family 38 C-terminal domain-containing protein [Pleomorphomonas koreensis]
MPLTLAQRIDRLDVRVAELESWKVRERRPLAALAFDGTPIAVGDPWPRADGVVRFSLEGRLPEDWPIENSRLSLDLGGESLITIACDGGEPVPYGLDPYHQSFPLTGRAVRVETETVARLPFGEPVRRPHVNRAELQLMEPAVDALWLLVTQAIEAARVLEGHDVVPHLVAAAEDTLRGLDWPSSTADYIARTAGSEGQQKIWRLPELIDAPAGLNQAERASVAAAYDALVARLAALQERFPPEGEIGLTGHAHIDLGWLWPYGETRRKTRRTFSTALSLMAASKDFRFNQSTAHYYAQLAEDDPALFERIAARIRSGEWETVGGSWVEPDTNMPSGESLTRQYLYGQRYFQKTFGIRHDVCWQPDCFGFTGALPQLLKQAGIRSFFTIKVNWSETNRIPSDLFWWEGLDGSRVLAHTFDNPMQGYNGFVRPDCHVPTWRNFREKARHPETLLCVGYGDGGGGPTPEMLAREEQLRVFPTLPKARWTRVTDFFARAHQTASETPLSVWQGEIYLELHRGTLTSQSVVKRLHRKAERALITAETAASLAHLIGAPKPVSLEPAWRTLLKNEFHDILPGSSIREVYEDAAGELGAVIDEGMKAQAAALDAIAARLPKGEGSRLLVVNPSLDVRPLRLTLEDGAVVSSSETLPPLAVAVVDAGSLKPAGALSVGRDHLENDVLRVTLAADGSIASILHKPTGREALDGYGNRLMAYPVDKPRNWDAWDIEGDYAMRGEEITDLQSLEVVEQGPHRVAVKIVRRFRSSTITQVLSLVAGGRRLDIRTTLDWHDRRVFLRTLTAVNARSRTATAECAYGIVSRPTHANTTWDAAMFEAAAHRFLDLSEPDFGVALLNDAKYGHSVRDNVLGLSLLRSPVYPDPLADEGEQTFTYALMPHAGAWYAGGVREEADDLNQPLIVRPVDGVAAGVYRPVRAEGIPAALSVLKPAEEGDGLILRVWEPAGRRGDFGLSLDGGWTVDGPVSILEEPMDVPERGLRPFEVKSWRLSKT